MYGRPSWNKTLSGDQDEAQAMQDERVQPLFLPGIRCPCLTPIGQCADNAGIAHYHLSYEKES